MDIKVITELTQLLSLNCIEVEKILVTKNKRYSQTYDLLINGIDSEDVLKNKLYPDKDKQNQYRVFKSRYFELIIDLLFQQKMTYSEVTNKVELQNVLILRTWVICQYLSKTLSSKAFASVLEFLYKRSKKYDLIEMKFLIIQELRFKYCLFIKNEEKYKKYDQEYLYTYREFNYLFKLKKLYSELGRYLVRPKKVSQKPLVERAKNQLVEFENDKFKFDSYFLMFYYFNCKYFIYLIKKDPSSLIITCNDAINFFSSKKKGFPPMPIFQFNQNKGIAFLLLKDYLQAIESFYFCFSFKPKEGSNSWQYTYSYIFLTHILQQDYQKAYEVLCTVLNNSELKKLDVTFTEPWHIKEAFIHFLIKTGKIKPLESKQHKLRSFRLSRFMNEVNLFSKDKRGLNITINILQMLFLIIEEKYDLFLDRLNSLKQYDYKYLKQEEFIRSSSFIKMLQKIPSGKYDADEIRQKAAKYHQRLLDNPMDFSEKSLNIEIIPYERLWEEVVSLFENKSHAEA